MKTSIQGRMRSEIWRGWVIIPSFFSSFFLAHLPTPQSNNIIPIHQMMSEDLARGNTNSLYSSPKKASSSSPYHSTHEPSYPPPWPRNSHSPPQTTAHASS